MHKNVPILVIGAGSVGERHLFNLMHLGFTNLHVYRQRNLPFRNIVDTSIQVHTNWDAMANIPFAFAIICTPTSQHLQQTLDCLDRGIHVLVEKPLSHNLAHYDLLTQKIKDTGRLVYVAYMMRFHPHLQAVKKIITACKYGKLHSMQTHWGSYLPDWHPYEDYHLSYAAQKNLGGGVALTLSHDLDMVNWMAASPVKKVHRHFGYSEHLQIDVESVADFQIVYENNVVAQVHLNYLETKPKRTYEFLFDQAKISLDYFASTMVIQHNNTTVTDCLDSFDRNQMFLAELSFFIEQLSTNNYLKLSLEQVAESATIINMCTHE